MSRLQPTLRASGSAEVVTIQVTDKWPPGPRRARQSEFAAARSCGTLSEVGTMAMRITRAIIEAYLDCAYKGHLKFAGESGTRSDYEAMTAAAEAASREQAVARLVARFGEGD